MLRRPNSPIVLLLLLAVSACGPSGGEHGGHGALGLHHGGMMLLHHALRLGMHGVRPPGFRRACAEDVEKLCANSDTRRAERECLEGKRALLSSECREALDRRREHEGESAR